MRPRGLTRRALLIGATAAGAALPAVARGGVRGPVLDELSVVNDAAAAFAGDRQLLTTLAPGGTRGRDSALVRFRLRRAAHVELAALSRNAPGAASLAAEKSADGSEARVLSSESRLLRPGRHELVWTPPVRLAPGTYALRLTFTDLLGRRSVFGSASPAHPDRLPCPVVRLVGIDAAPVQRSYIPGDTARFVVAADAPSLTTQLFRSGTESEPTYANNTLNGDAVEPEQTLDWSANVDSPDVIEVPLPGTLSSGVHYLRLASPDGRLGFAPFVVRPIAPTCRVALVMPTNTWQAYNFTDANGDGYGDSWYVSWHTHSVDLTRSHKSRGVPYRYRSYELSFLHWLARTQKQADVYADEDLEGFAAGDDLKAAYDLVVFPGHTEYVTTHAYDVVQRYRDLGGNLIFLSANNFFRRVDRIGTDLRLIDLWRKLGRPEAGLVGVQYRASDRGTHQSPFVVTPEGAQSFAFAGTGLQAGSSFGRFGIEIDALAPSSPPGTTVLAEIPNALGPGLTAQMTYYETAAGARVFAAGVLNFGGQVLLWPQTAQLLENVWAHLAPGAA